MTVKGEGATFPKPVYAQWSLRYLESNAVKVAYRAVDSEAGLAAIRAKRVDFGASDVPLSPHQLDKDGLCQFPVVIGAVVPVVHLPGISSAELRLTAEDLAGVYLGTITRWSDPAIAESNPGLALPDEAIIPIHRLDASGTTWILTKYLSEHVEAWRAAVGTGKKVHWPVGVGAESNAQVAKFVGKFKHTIGYVEYSYALENGLTCVTLRNSSGRFVAPSRRAFQAAAQRGRGGAGGDLRMSFNADAAEGAWPIIGASYALVRGEQDNPARAKAMLEFFHWALTRGAEYARGLEYVTIPQALVQRIELSWSGCIGSAGSPLWPPPELTGGPDAAPPPGSAATPPSSARPSPSPQPPETTITPAAPAP